MRILDEKSVHRAVIRKQIDRSKLKPAKSEPTPAPKKDLQRIESLLAQIGESMQAIAKSGNGSEPLIASAVQAIADVTATLQRLAPERPTHWTFEVQRNAKGLIESIEARR
jgi:hypothetical protein